MGVATLLTKWRDALWRMTHPQEARRREEEIDSAEQDPQNYNDALLELRKRQEEWRRVVDDPNSPVAALANAIQEEERSWVYVFRLKQTGADSTILDQMAAWRMDFECALFAHPNLPPDLFGRKFVVNESTVSGLLRNPALPLILLECPDFIDQLSEADQSAFFRLALQNDAIPPVLLSLLKTIHSPWLALEAQTHISLEDPEVPVLPDMEWLDIQITKIIQNGTLARCCLIYELAYHGLLPSTIELSVPWSHFDVPVPNDVASHPIVRELIEEINKLPEHGAKEREDALVVWVENMLFYKDRNAKLPYLEAALFHPMVPPWVGKCIAKGWSQGQSKRNVWSMHRLITMRQGKATDAVLTHLRETAIREALETWKELRNPTHSNLGIFYFVARGLPDLLEGGELNPKYRTLSTSETRSPDIRQRSFLIRLTIALRLDDTDPEQQEWREILRNDPNRYVRAAARKEITWPETNP